MEWGRLLLLLHILYWFVRLATIITEAATAMRNDLEEVQETGLEDHGDSYLCRHCNHEGLKPTFGVNVRCPVCGSNDIVGAEFWRRMKKLSASADRQG